VLQVWYPVLACPLLALGSGAGGKVSAFRKKQKPHWMGGAIELLQVLGHVWLVLFPVSFHEDELAKLHSPPNDRNVPQGLLEDDV